MASSDLYDKVRGPLGGVDGNEGIAAALVVEGGVGLELMLL